MCTLLTIWMFLTALFLLHIVKVVGSAIKEHEASTSRDAKLRDKSPNHHTT